MRVHILGAAETVTGSKYLVETDSHKFLVDCGLFQGRKSMRQRNWRSPEFDPAALHGVLLTHAHIDHTGYLPVLVKHGFHGPIYCSPATAKLLALLLPDSAYLQEEEARYANKVGSSSHKPAAPLYTQADAQKALKLLHPFEQGSPQELFQRVHVDARRTGHIIGACSLGIEHGGKRILFSGDVGRYDVPLLVDPQPTELGDLVICEATYGDKTHADDDVRARLKEVIHRSVQRGGPLIIPSFAIGRTQTLLYLLGELERAGDIPVLPVFVDSPMAIDATELYRDFNFDFDSESQKIIASGEKPLRTEQTVFCETVDDSKRLNQRQGPGIIISASGMVTGGRILHHMRRRLPDDRTTVLFVGFQAHGTRGRIIESGAKEVKIFGDYVPINATIESISGLSAHGDRNELLRWLDSCSGSPRQVRIVHAEPEPGRAFAAALRERFNWDAQPATYEEIVEV